MLDRNKDYAVVSAIPGVSYEQDGKLYDVNGFEVSHRHGVKITESPGEHEITRLEGD